MKRLHVSIGATDLAKSVRFYEALFGREPTMRKDDYVQWILDDPAVNFSVVNGSNGGVSHLGIQAENEQELDEIYARFDATDQAVLDEGETVCCYARSNKHWVSDPQEIRWEGFLTHERTEEFFGGSACCAEAQSETQSEATGCEGSGCC
jgi:catechol 2,3-dioxygenase-like lactoylglutathione lyase family enzyme